MSLSRRMLKELGLEADVIDKIMDSYGSSMADVITKAESEEAVKKAVESAKKEWETNAPKPVIVKDSDEYKELASKYADLELNTKLIGAKVKDKYRDFVKQKLSRDKEFDEAIKEVKDSYAEFFDVEEQKKEPAPAPEKKPAFTGGGGKKDEDEPKTEEDKVKEMFMKAFTR